MLTVIASNNFCCVKSTIFIHFALPTHKDNILIDVYVDTRILFKTSIKVRIVMLHIYSIIFFVYFYEEIPQYIRRATVG